LKKKETMTESRVLFYIDSGRRNHIPWPVRLFCDTSASDWALIHERLTTLGDDCSVSSVVDGTECPITFEDFNTVIEQAKDAERYAQAKSALVHVFNVELIDPTRELLGLEPLEGTTGRKRPIFNSRKNEDADDEDSGPAESSESRGDSSYEEDDEESSSNSNNNSGSIEEEEEYTSHLYKASANDAKKAFRQQIREYRRHMQKLRAVRRLQRKQRAGDFDAETPLPAAKKSRRH
jgi:hypothetical protein